jgi:RNA polymerase sigma-70 factor (ECF subfamily)
MATHSAIGADSGGTGVCGISRGLAKAGSRQPHTADDTDQDPASERNGADPRGKGPVTVLASTSDFSAAYREHYPLAFSTAYRVLRDAAAAEDVVQEVFTTLWRDPGKFDSQRGSLAGYVAMMAGSRAIDRIRSRNACSAAADRLAVLEVRREQGVESPADAVMRRDEAGRVLAAVAELPAAQRDVVLMAYGRGLSTVEIAKAAGVPPGTAKSRLRQGLQRTRQALSAADWAESTSTGAAAA